VANFGHAPAINAVAETQLISVYDPVALRAEDFARRHSVPRAFSDLDAFLDSGIEAVTIASPAGAHLVNVQACASRGVAVLCEKPIAATVSDAELIVETVSTAQIPFMVGFVYRYSPVATKILDWVRGGVIGNVRSIRLVYIWHLHGRYLQASDGSWQESTQWIGRMREGGPMVDCGVHLIDLARWWTGSEIVRVSGNGAWVADYEAPDHVYAHLDHENGCHTMVETSFSYGHTTHDPAPFFTYELIGDGGFIRYDRGTWRLEAHDGQAIHIGPSASEKGFWEMYADWARSLRSGDTRHLPSGHDALRASEFAVSATDQAIRRRIHPATPASQLKIVV